MPVASLERLEYLNNTNYVSTVTTLNDEIKIILVNVKIIYSSEQAFAARNHDGTVVTLGNDKYGADSNSVTNELKDILLICSTQKAFAALKDDGSVIAWGNSSYGGTIKRVTHSVCRKCKSLIFNRKSVCSFKT